MTNASHKVFFSIELSRTDLTQTPFLHRTERESDDNKDMGFFRPLKFWDHTKVGPNYVLVD